MRTKIKSCHCRHEYQDRRYGPGQRVHNLATNVPSRWRCTVCGREKLRKKGGGESA